MQRNNNRGDGEGDDLHALLNNQNVERIGMRACRRLKDQKTKLFLIEAAWCFFVLYLWLYSIGTDLLEYQWRQNSFFAVQVLQICVFVAI